MDTENRNKRKKAKKVLSDRQKKVVTVLSVDALKNEYPDAKCMLNYDNPFQLLVAVRLSAQCTDARVNLVTPALFKKYPTIYDFAAADVSDVAELIHSCGFYKRKSEDIVNMAKMIISDYGARVPDEIDELVKLPGVGRKTANLIVGDVYSKPAVVCDTHMIRIANRLGLVETQNPEKVEKQLRALLPDFESSDFCHRAVLHGRAVCSARKPKCGECSLNEFCRSARDYI